MDLDTAEKWVRWAGAAGALVGLGEIVVGLWRGAHHAKGRTTGSAPALVRVLQSGSLAFYLPVSAAGSGLLYWLWRPLPLPRSDRARAVALGAGALLYFPGLALFLWGRQTMGEMYNVSTSISVQLYADHRLITTGPFALVRHPIYVGGQMMELGALLIYRTWTTALIVPNIPVLVLRARREEEALASEFGQEWTEYCQRVPAWIPRLRK